MNYISCTLLKQLPLYIPVKNQKRKYFLKILLKPKYYVSHDETRIEIYNEFCERIPLSKLFFNRTIEEVEETYIRTIDAKAIQLDNNLDCIDYSYIRKSVKQWIFFTQRNIDFKVLCNKALVMFHKYKKWEEKGFDPLEVIKRIEFFIDNYCKYNIQEFKYKNLNSIDLLALKELNAVENKGVIRVNFNNFITLD